MKTPLFIASFFMLYLGGMDLSYDQRFSYICDSCNSIAEIIAGYPISRDNPDSSVPYILIEEIHEHQERILHFMSMYPFMPLKDKNVLHVFLYKYHQWRRQLSYG